jgi:hypothetical protein
MRPSIHYDRAFSEYRQMAGLNWSILKHPTALAQRYHATQPDDEHDPLYSALHCALLEPERFAVAYQLADGRRTAARKAEAEAAGVTLLTERDMDTISLVRAAVQAHPEAAEWLKDPPGDDGDGSNEVSIQWAEPHGGRMWAFKARLDRLIMERVPHPTDPEDVVWNAYLIDLKAVPRVSPRHVAVEIARRGYHGQLAHYAAGVRALWPAARVRCLIIAYESRPPYDVGVFSLPEDGAQWAGERMRAAAIERYVQAHTSGVWPGACPQTVEVELPRWAPGLDSEDAGADYEEEV